VPFREFLGAANVAIILLLGVQVLAIAGGRRGGVAAAIVAALSFDFFTEPYLRLVITDQHDIITTVLLLVAGIATSELGTFAVRRALKRTRHQEQ
jgi:K+-sensing histidine kinase KdpD